MSGIVYKIRHKKSGLYSKGGSSASMDGKYGWSSQGKAWSSLGGLDAMAAVGATEVRVEVCGRRDHRQLARCGHHPGLLRVFSVGVFASRSRGSAGGAGVFGERVCGDL